MTTIQRRRNSAQTSDAIIAAATKLFLEQGYSKTNLEQVAKAAGVTKPTVYSHFGSKQALLKQVTAHNADRRVAEMSSELQPTDDVRLDLTRFGDAILATVLSDESGIASRSPRRWNIRMLAKRFMRPDRHA